MSSRAVSPPKRDRGDRAHSVAPSPNIDVVPAVDSADERSGSADSLRPRAVLAAVKPLAVLPA